MEATGCGRRTSRVSYLRASQLVTTPNPAVQRTGGIAVLAPPAVDRNVLKLKIGCLEYLRLAEKEEIINSSWKLAGVLTGFVDEDDWLIIV